MKLIAGAPRHQSHLLGYVGTEREEKYVDEKMFVRARDRAIAFPRQLRPNLRFLFN